MVGLKAKAEPEKCVAQIASSLCASLVSDWPKSQHLFKNKDGGLNNRGRNRNRMVRHEGIGNFLERFRTLAVIFTSDMRRTWNQCPG
jgi:hypothetical protein